MLRPSDRVNLAQMSPEEVVDLLGRRPRQALSHTRLDKVLNCPRKYAWSYEEGLEPMHVKPALSLGKAYQRGIEADDPAEAGRTLLESREVRSQEDADKAEIDAATVEAAAALYLERWPRRGEAEVHYRVPLRNPATGHYSRTFDLQGYADELISNDVPYGPELVENKLVGAITEQSIRRLRFDRQITLACYGLWRATGALVAVVHYRFLRKPSIKPTRGESVESFVERLRSDYRERPDFYAHAESLFRSWDDLEELEHELWTWADDMRRHQRRGFWPKNTSTCTAYGGCEYVPLCAGDPDARSLYRPREERTAA